MKMDHDCSRNLTIVHRGKLATGCDLCLDDQAQQGNDLSAKYRRDTMRRDYRKDLIQKNQPREFVKAFGAERAREVGYTEEQIRKYG